ncbi:MAG: agmatinase [Candidatus Bathyarchaeota archaeon]|nr:MAG: agmatinase [Candidatus Bathyarchaeota archaeon]
MSYRDLFVSPSPVFTGSQEIYEAAKYAILGVPFDVTSTYRSGAKFAPLAIRDISQNIECYSFRSGIDIEDLQTHDLGDLHVAADVELTLGRLALVAQDLFDEEKIPVFIGGEHTITLGVARCFDENVTVVSFDAHLDLRDNYLGLNVSHTTFMRRINESVKPAKILEIGTRAVCKEELDYAREANIDYMTALQIRKDGVKKAVEEIKKALKGSKKVYITVDMDVLDPAFVPAVPNPEPEGLDTSTLLDLLETVCEYNVIGFDVVEVAPQYDQGVTATQAAKVIFEMLGFLECKQKRS